VVAVLLKPQHRSWLAAECLQPLLWRHPVLVLLLLLVPRRLMVVAVLHWHLLPWLAPHFHLVSPQLLLLLLLLLRLGWLLHLPAGVAPGCLLLRVCQVAGWC
jgi:hypothetical protein